MDTDSKKTALRMIPYGLYVLTGEDAGGRTAAATVNWVSQASFSPPLVTVGVKVDSSAHGVILEAKSFALNMLGEGQQELAFAFFKPAERVGDRIGGECFRTGETGAPLLERAAAYVECRLVDTLQKGDHSVFLGEVVAAGVAAKLSGRPDEAILKLRDLGEKTFYGG